MPQEDAATVATGRSIAPDSENHSRLDTSSSSNPHSLRDALREAGRQPSTDSPASETSEEDYDEMQRRPVVYMQRKTAAEKPAASASPTQTDGRTDTPPYSDISESPSFEELHRLKTGVSKTSESNPTYMIAADDHELKEILRRGLQRAKEPSNSKARRRFSDLVFSRSFSTFDRQNTAAASSPFRGFYILFWTSVFLFIVKIGAENWRDHGNPLGTNVIMRAMFKRDVIVLLLSDGVMCGLTGVSWILQRLIYAGYLDWDRSGWIIQNIWQTTFLGAVIGWTMVRDWPWSHTVFFVLHGLTMLMKMHSYSFYNGYLSTLYKKRVDLLRRLKELEYVSPVQGPSATQPPASSISTSHLANPATGYERRASVSHLAGLDGLSDIDKITGAIKSGQPLDIEQIHVFEKMIKWEVDALTDELQGKATRAEGAYPHNLTVANHYEWIVFPTLVYELEYPRSDSIDWAYVAEKMAATFGILFVMIMVSQTFIYPVVMKTLEMKEVGMPLSERFREFPWMLSDLIFPMLIEYLMTWYLIWETILNWLAELTYFADRSFYSTWWNSVSWDQFARDWNRPVHNFLLRHVYHSSISALKVNKHTATLITFFLSACVHELIMWCIFKKLRGYLLMLQMCQLPLVAISRTSWLKGRSTLGNLLFWLGIFSGPSILCSLYLIL